MLGSLLFGALAGTFLVLMLEAVAIYFIIIRDDRDRKEGIEE